MTTVALFLVLFSHALAAMPFISSIRRGKIPNTADFAAISVIFYYDLGMILEALGSPYVSVYFNSLMDADQSTFLFSMVFIGLAPWLFHAGSALIGTAPRQPQEPPTDIVASRRVPFYAIITLITLTLVAYGALQLVSGRPLWVLRTGIGEFFGPLIIVLYLPLHFLAFYVRQKDSRTKWGTLFVVGLAVACVVVLAPAGERTNLLLPFLILLLFRFRLSLARIAVATASLLVLAALLLTLFKWQYAAASSSLGVGTLVMETIHNDIDRSPVLRTAMEMSEPAGTKVMEYPMAGYVYSGLFFVPRQIAPFKGVSTAQSFTASIVDSDPESTNWGFGLGAIEEILVNAGSLFVIPGLLIYGMIMGLLDRASLRVPALVVPARFAAVWLCGYHLPAILLEFGAMMATVLVMHAIFVNKASLRRVPLFERATEKTVEASGPIP